MSWANFSAKCPGLNKQTKNLSKFEEEKKKKKLSFGFQQICGNLKEKKLKN